MFSEKHRYILKTLSYLSTIGTEDYTTISNLTERLDIPRGYLNRIIPKLVDMGYLESKKGLGGGVKLARPANEIRMSDLLEDTGALLHRTEESYEECCVPEVFDECMIDIWMDDFRSEVIKESTLEDMRNRLTPSS
ncbi:MAG: Rrf2 family transcriptional regulator [bacterium]